MYRRILAVSMTFLFLGCSAGEENIFETRFTEQRPNNGSDPSLTQGDINIDVCKMQYSENFDCDDFAFAADVVLEDLGFASWQVSIRYNKAGQNGKLGHVLNIVEVNDANSVNPKFCLYEPQTNSVLQCWHQGTAGRPVVPQFVLNTYAQRQGITNLTVYRIWDDGHSTTAGEQCFIENPTTCAAYESCTGYCAPRR